VAVGAIGLAQADTVSVIARGDRSFSWPRRAHRGRVSAVEHIVGVSGPHLGGYRAGLVASATSASFAAISGGVLCVLGVADSHSRTAPCASSRPLTGFSNLGPARSGEQIGSRND
jgi:hypothetical protein